MRRPRPGRGLALIARDRSTSKRHQSATPHPTLDHLFIPSSNGFLIEGSAKIIRPTHPNTDGPSVGVFRRGQTLDFSGIWTVSPYDSSRTLALGDDSLPSRIDWMWIGRRAPAGSRTDRARRETLCNLRHMSHESVGRSHGRPLAGRRGWPQGGQSVGIRLFSSTDFVRDRLGCADPRVILARSRWIHPRNQHECRAGHRSHRCRSLNRLHAPATLKLHL